MKIRIILFLSLTFIFCPKSVFASINGLVINEFQIGKTGFSTDEYIGIYNSGSNPILLDGYLITKKASTGTESKIHLFPSGAGLYIQAKTQIFLAHRTGYSGSLEHIDYSYSNSISANNVLYLVDSKGTVIDRVGWGEGAVDYEKVPIPSVGPDDVWQRRNGQDSDDNEADFVNLNAPKELEIDSNARSLIISELFPNPKEGEEWIEIYNPTSQTVSLNGLKLCDMVGKTHCFSFLADDLILPFSYKSFDQTSTRITLNNDGDGAQIVDYSDNVVYETSIFDDTSEGESFSLFGSIWKWTKVPTRNKPNEFVSTIEDEKTSKKTNKKRTVSGSNPIGSSGLKNDRGDEEVKAAEDTLSEKSDKVEYSPKIGKREIGWATIVLAILLLLGYTIFENKEKIHEIYLKFSRRNK